MSAVASTPEHVGVSVEPWFPAQLYVPGTRDIASGAVAIVRAKERFIVLGHNDPPDPPQAHQVVMRGPGVRTQTVVETPHWINAVWVEADGSWLAGAHEGYLFTSQDQGRSWEPAGRVRRCAVITSVCRFAGELWIAGDAERGKGRGLENRGVVLRRVGTRWRNVAVPAEAGAQQVERIVVLGEQLYVVGSGIWRWNGRALVDELAAPTVLARQRKCALQRMSRGQALKGRELKWLWRTTLKTLAVTPTGTMLAAGGHRTVWRKPVGGEWEALEPAALYPDRPSDVPGWEDFELLIALGDRLLLLSRDEPSDRIRHHPLRVSEADGRRFVPVDLGA